VRAIYDYGCVYEGTMTPDCKQNGWGVWYGGDQDGFIWVGWFKDGYQNGNCMRLDGNDWAIREGHCGWYEMNNRKGEQKDDDELKNFNLQECF